MECQTKRPLHSYMSRKRYLNIMGKLNDDGMDPQWVAKVMDTISTELNFDPNNNPFIKYKREFLQKKAAETGLTIHELSGSKRSRERKKADATT